jgi:hypothetical protein
MLLAANWTVVASTPGRGSAATGLTPFVVAAGWRILEPLARQENGKSFGRLVGTTTGLIFNPRQLVLPHALHSENGASGYLLRKTLERRRSAVAPTRS